MSSNNELVLPGTYVDMDQAEIEYDGGMSNWGMFFAICGIAFAGGLALSFGSLGVMAISEGAGLVVLNIGAGVCALGLAGAVLGSVPYGVSSAMRQAEEKELRNHHS